MSAEDQVQQPQTTSPGAPPDVEVGDTDPGTTAAFPEVQHPAVFALKLVDDLHVLHNSMGSFVLSTVADKMAELKNHLQMSQ